MSLTVDGLTTEARRISGQSDFGDESFVEGLRVLLRAIETEARLTEAGTEMTRQQFTSLLVNRLLMQRDLVAHPEILDEEVIDPVLVIGLPRTGTTKLQRMLAADPRHQRLESWRMGHPAPMPGSEGVDPDPRIALAEQASAMLATHFPEAAAAHPTGARDVDEDQFLLQMTFEHDVFTLLFDIPSYDEWLRNRPRNRVFAYERQLLQYLQWQDGGGRGRSWILKSPNYIAYLPDFLSVFPDTVLVRCHRDPRVVIPSLARTLEVFRRLRTDDVDLAALGSWNVDYWSGLMRRHLADERALRLADRIIDAPYEDITARPMDVLESVYQRLGLPMTDECTARIDGWIEENPQHRHGRHVYSAQRYSLTPETIDAAFADYNARFSRPTTADIERGADG